MSISKNLKELRIESGLSQAQLAERTGLSQSAIARWELGKTEPTASVIELLAEFFNISTETLLQGDVDILFTPNIQTATADSNMKNLKIFRKERGLTQTQVADAVGIGRQAYAYYEKGEREPSTETLCKLADFFGVTVDELLGRTPQLFDDARVERPEIMELYELMTPQQKSNLINYARGMLAASATEENPTLIKRRA